MYLKLTLQNLQGRNLIGEDPKVGPLADNGGPTPTHALLAGSPAIDAGDDAELSPPWSLATDQRGQPRKAGTHVDIGAFELAPLLPTARITSGRPAASGAFELAISGTVGCPFSVWTSRNLNTWTRIGSCTEISPGRFFFSDDGTNSSVKFYQLRWP